MVIQYVIARRWQSPSQFEAMFVSAVHSYEDLEKTCDAIKGYLELNS